MTDNDKKMMELLEASMPEYLLMKQMIDNNEINLQDVMRALYLITNIKQVTRWGKVTFLIQDGRIVSVSQEQQFKSVV